MISNRFGLCLWLLSLSAVPSLASAQSPAPERRKIDVSRDPKAVTGALERFRKAGSGVRGAPIPKVSHKKHEITGRVIRGGHGEVLLEREIDPAAALALERMGYRVVKSEKEIADRTLIGNKVYVLYEMDAQAFYPGSESELRGVRVKVAVRHDAKGTPIITELQRADR